MLVYHGSINIVEKPEIRGVGRPMDFGAGFYTTLLEEQAIQWALRKGKRSKFQAVVNIYEFDKKRAKEYLNIKEFRIASREWVDLILLHRKMNCYNEDGLGIKGIHHNYDIVIGEVADDDVYDAIELFESGILNKEELVKRVKYKSKNNQITFNTLNSLEYLKYCGNYLL